MKPLAHLAATLLALALPRAAAAQPQDETVAGRGFAIPQTREARALAETALGHIEAKRWSEAFTALQTLLVQHRGEVLLPPNVVAPDGTPLDELARVGAAMWASERLAELPEAARALYATRYGTEALEALELARRTRDTRALLEVARRYPLTPSASDAWWTLGDLEFERGELENARTSWQRAAELGRLRGAQPPPGATARLELVASLAELPQETAAELPGADAVGWTQVFARPQAITPFSQGSSNCIYPFVSGDTVLVTDTLQLFAFDAWSGEKRWETPEPAGWSAVDRGEYRPDGKRPIARREFFENLHKRSLMVRPAAAAGVAVAALQIPWTAVYNETYQNYEITNVIPERRLYAFDLATGRELWNHRPPLVWDGMTGELETRLSVAAPPVIAGSRVVVPYYRMQGRVDLHVGCFDLYTGQRLWSSSLISGQMALNMFGRQLHEYNAPPVTITGDKVIVSTQLGAIAALDLYSGDIAWQTLYEQIPVPRASHWEIVDRPQVFATAPAAVVGGLVVCAPIDSYEFFALDLETGRRLWSRPHSSFRRPSRELLALLGADAERVWFSGTRVMSQRAPRGLAISQPVELSESVDVTSLSEWPRPVLTARHVVVARPDGRAALLREALKSEDARATAEWSGGERPGNLAIAEGALYTTTSSGLTGIVDWRAVEERFRRRSEAAPEDPEPALDWAAVLERRAQAELESARIETGLELLAQARAKLAPFSAPADDALRANVRGRMYSIHLHEARAFELAADPSAALERLAAALPLAATPADALRVQVERLDLQELLGLHEERAALLAELGSARLERDMPAEWWARRGAERFQSCLPLGTDTETFPTSLYLALESAREARRRGDVAAELRCLHMLLAGWGDLSLPIEPPASASGRIAELASANPQAHAPYEDLAREALARARAEDDPDAIERLAALYPHTQAAREAERARLEHALAQRDWRRLVAIVQRSIPDDWTPEVAHESELQSLCVLRAALEDLGNPDFAQALARRLARAQPELVSTLARDEHKTLAELAPTEVAPRPRATTTEFAAFDGVGALAHSLDGQFMLLGNFELPLKDGTRDRVQLVRQRISRSEIVQAYAASHARQPLWSQALDTGAVRLDTHAELAAGVLVIGGANGITALEPLDGSVRWRWTRGTPVEAHAVVSGVVLAVTRNVDGRAVLVGLEAREGLELWSRTIPANLWAHRPVVGPEHVVLLPSDWAQSPAHVIDPFTGSRVTTLRLGAHVGEADAAGAWIEGQRLFLPSFPKSSSPAERDCISAWDLASGTRAWRAPCEDGLEFDSILRVGDAAYLVYLPGSQSPRGTVAELSLRIGAVRRLPGVEIASDAMLVGVRRHSVVELDAPLLVLRAPSADGATTELRGVELPFGRSWTHVIPALPAALYNTGPMPLPLVARDTVVLAYTELPRSRGQASVPKTQVLVLDRASGAQRELMQMPDNVGRAEQLELTSVGPSLWVTGQNGMFVRAKP
jgi:outer membrane protein assembly factor BamB